MPHSFDDHVFWQQDIALHVPLYVVVCPRTVSTDLNDLTCKTPLVVGAPGVATQRITSSAWKRRGGGMVIPSAWAVLRLITSSNAIGRSTGRSAGLVPCRILSI
jgi:hypothetical protein